MAFVKIDSCQSFWRGEVTIKGIVTEEDGEYNTTVTVRDGKIKTVFCGCGRGESCTHAEALRQAYVKLTEKKSRISAVTSEPLKEVMEHYSAMEIDQVMTAEEKGEAHLTVSLLIEPKKLKLAFKIGTKKKSYILKDLTEFYNLMKHRERKEYGKSFALTHTLWAFDAESRPLAEFIMEQVEEAIDYYKEYNPYRPVLSMKMREISLNKRNMDDFFALCLNRELQAEECYQKRIAVQVREENPDFQVEIRETEGEGYELQIEKGIYVYQGKKGLYIYRQGVFFVCSTEYKKDMEGFLMKLQSSESFHLNRRDMPRFCGQCIPVVKKHVDLKTEFDIAEYMPQPVEAEFTFDIMEDGITVTCEEKLIYGDFSFNPVKGTNVPVGITRDYTGEYRIRAAAERYFQYAEDTTGKLFISDEEGIFRLLEEGMQEFMLLGRVYVSEEMKKVRIRRPNPAFVGISLEGKLLELSIDTEGIPEEELLKLLESYRLKKRYYRLKNGEFIRIEDTALHALSELADGLSLTAGDIKSGRVTVPAYRAMYVEQVLSGNGSIGLSKNREFRALIKALRNANDNEFDVPSALLGTLREYQKTGYRWMRTLEQYGFGGILADDMGLGKTIQVLSVLLDRKEALEQEPALIVCPASLVYNWENEIKRFTPELKAELLVGSAGERERKMQQPGMHVWITSYDLLKRDVELYQKYSFTYEIIDEAQMIKNHTTQGARAVKSIQAKTRFALTGTPIENRLSELWSIFDYLMPGFLYSYSRFREELETAIVKEQDEAAVRKLRRLVGPFILRRLKKDVLKELPDKLERVVYAGMEEEQKKLYQAAAARLSKRLRMQSEEEFKTAKFQTLAELTRLRQICCDPSLCYENYGGASAKLEVCIRLVEEGLEGGHKLLIFSQFTSMLEIIGKRLKEMGIAYYQITGQTEKQQRVESAERFNTDDTGVFLVSLKAGGTGLNLTGADMVIHYDPWWNAAAQNQATDRAHRIGQRNVVTVCRLIAKGTIEENILRLQERKQMLSEQIIQLSEMGLGALELSEVLELLDFSG